MAVLHVVDGVAQHPLRLGLGEHLRPDGVVAVGGDHQERAGEVTPLVGPGNMRELAAAHQVAQPVGHRRGDHDDVGLGLEQGPGLALRLGAPAGDHAAPAGQLEGDGIPEGHASEIRTGP